MATGDAPAGSGPGLARFIEWVVLAAVLLALCVVAWQQSRQLQDQAELASVRATVRALRQALFLKQLQSARGAFPQAVGNPFDLLEVRPPNYAGPLGLGEALAREPGIWLYDAVCGCVAYLPRTGSPFSAASRSEFLVLKVHGEAGDIRLLPREAYFWAGQPML